jgi:prepilin-type N-terminal cleavage/methylation domain-containing protein
MLILASKRHANAPMQSVLAPQGFTLLELLLVLILIVLLVSAGLQLTLTDTDADPHNQLQDLAAAVQLAQQEAVLSGAIVGLDFYQEQTAAAPNAVSYRWLTQQDGHWQALEVQLHAEPSLALTLGSEGSTPQLVVEQQLQAPEPLQALDDKRQSRFTPEVMFLPSREVTAFTLQLTQVQLQVDAFGRAEVLDVPQ